jgi:hypothetical protein
MVPVNGVMEQGTLHRLILGEALINLCIEHVIELNKRGAFN